MTSIRLALKNAFRHKLRTTLTLVGLAVAIMAYGLLDTVIEAWYANAQSTSTSRLITRSTISLAYPLPVHYAERIRNIEGVSSVTWASWFGGTYEGRRKPFPMFAVEAGSYFKLFPEFMLTDAELQAFQQDRQGAIIGPQMARAFGFKVGDVIPIQGDIYPGNWGFTVRGIYKTKDDKADQTMMMVHWQLLSESLRSRFGGELMDRVGVFIVGLDDATQASDVARRIDALFHNSPAETRTETERAYQLGIVAMSHNILTGIRLVSVVLILIMMAVMANTMTMSAAERLAEYATLKALGFSPGFIVKLLFTESLLIGLAGGLLGIALTYPASAALIHAVGSMLKGYEVSPDTMASQVAFAVAVSLMAAAWPAWKMSRIDVATALRHAA
jgi:putative ABC transport system permease protein